MSDNVHYNLRNRASGPHPGTHSGLAPLPSTFQNPLSRGTDSATSDGEQSDTTSVVSSARSSVRPGVSYSQAASHRVGADTASLSDQEANQRVSGAHTLPSNGREAYPRSTTPQSGTAGASSLSHSDKENIFPSSLPCETHETSSSLTSMNITSEEVSGNSLWTKVRRKKRHASSLDSATPQNMTPPHAAMVPPAGTAPLNDERWHAVNAAEKSLSKEERSHIEKRMRTINKSRDTLQSRGAGPLTMAKGKAVDARNWGVVGIDAAELDPKAQQKAFAQFLAHKSKRREAALQYYAAIKAAKRQQNKPTVRTVMDESDQDQGAHKVHGSSTTPLRSHTSSCPEPTSHEDLERQITALRRELDEVQRAGSRSKQQEQSHSESQLTGAASHTPLRDDHGNASLSEAGAAQPDESISKALKSAAKPSKHKSSAKKGKSKAKVTFPLLDPSWGMATTIVEEALQPGCSVK
ncbi:hypothetical protein V8D89_012194 [Ganoderma adspersum]